MKNSRRGFSFIEVLLVLIIAGLLATVFIPAAVKIRQDVRLEYIEENLDKIIEAGQQYNSERGTLLISYPALVEGKYLPKLESISGESYDKVNIESGGGTAEVVTSLGEKVKKEY